MESVASQAHKIEEEKRRKEKRKLDYERAKEQLVHAILEYVGEKREREEKEKNIKYERDIEKRRIQEECRIKNERKQEEMKTAMSTTLPDWLERRRNYLQKVNKQSIPDESKREQIKQVEKDNQQLQMIETQEQQKREVECIRERTGRQKEIKNRNYREERERDEKTERQWLELENLRKYYEAEKYRNEQIIQKENETEAEKEQKENRTVGFCKITDWLEQRRKYIEEATIRNEQGVQKEDEIKEEKLEFGKITSWLERKAKYYEEEKDGNIHRLPEESRLQKVNKQVREGTTGFDKIWLEQKRNYFDEEKEKQKMQEDSKIGEIKQEEKRIGFLKISEWLESRRNYAKEMNERCIREESKGEEVKKSNTEFEMIEIQKQQICDVEAVEERAKKQKDGKFRSYEEEKERIEKLETKKRPEWLANFRKYQIEKYRNVQQNQEESKEVEEERTVEFGKMANWLERKRKYMEEENRNEESVRDDGIEYESSEFGKISSWLEQRKKYYKEEKDRNEHRFPEESTLEKGNKHVREETTGFDKNKIGRTKLVDKYIKYPEERRNVETEKSNKYHETKKCRNDQENETEVLTEKKEKRSIEEEKSRNEQRDREEGNIEDSEQEEGETSELGMLSNWLERRGKYYEEDKDRSKQRIMGQKILLRQQLQSNPNLLDMIKLQLPANTRSYFVTEELKYSEYDFHWVQNLFCNTTKGKCLDITKIERVQNPYVLALYNLKKESLQHFYGSVKEVHLFYGVMENLVQPVLENNIDYRNKRQYKVANIKFSSIAFFESYNCDRTDKERIMLLCKVLISKHYEGSGMSPLPPDGYDTILNKETVYKYSDDTFYPSYKITFK